MSFETKVRDLMAKEGLGYTEASRQLAREQKHEMTIEGYCHACRCFPDSCDRTDHASGHDSEHRGHQD